MEHATVFFLSQFEHVLEPNFPASKGMVKKGKKNELSKYWKSKGQRMGHAETRNFLFVDCQERVVVSTCRQSHSLVSIARVVL
jgi:hypothetical protein